MVQNKNHWYDGRIYDLLIAPNLDSAYRTVKSIIPEKSSVLDAGCGTGRLTFMLADKCSLVEGIDLSRRNIDQAILNLRQRPLSNISFNHDDVRSFVKSRIGVYNYAVLSYVIHEIGEIERMELLGAISDSGAKIIVLDYLYPPPPGPWSLLNSVIEFFAGREHYLNFKSYLRTGGIQGLAGRAGFEIIQEIKDIPLARHIAVLIKKEIMQ